MSAQPDSPASSAQEATLEEEELARRFLRPLRIFAARRLGDAAEAEDVAQEAIRGVIQALRADRLRDPAALPGFVYQTALNLCLKRLRSLARGNRALQRLGPDGAVINFEDPFTVLVRVERRAAVRKALHRLEAGDRHLLELFYTEALSTAEVAVRMQANAGAIRVRKHRALLRLASLLEENQGNKTARSGTDR